MKYSNFSKTERLQYQSVKKLHGFLLNLLRCRALISVGRRGTWNNIEMKFKTTFLCCCIFSYPMRFYSIPLICHH